MHTVKKEFVVVPTGQRHRLRASGPGKINTVLTTSARGRMKSFAGTQRARTCLTCLFCSLSPWFLRENESPVGLLDPGVLKS